MTEITENDLNGIDRLNGSGSVSSKGTVLKFDVNGSESLKGAINKFNGGFNTQNARWFIESKRNQIVEYLTERFKYSGLPDELNKYRFENKIIENGSALFIKRLDKSYMFNYTQLDFNIYNEPTIVMINEPRSSLNGVKIDLTKEGAIIRNNLSKLPSLSLVFRHINTLERILFQIEKNITSSAPKGILNLRNNKFVFDENGDSPETDSFEEMINGENTFFALTTKDLSKQEMDPSEQQDIFIPIELTDRTENLIKNYQFQQDLIKEMIGSLTNNLTNKKERLVSDEQNAQQGLTNATLQHALEIRKVDIEKINEIYQTNITIELQSDERDELDENQNEEDKGGDEDE